MAVAAHPSRLSMCVLLALPLALSLALSLASAAAAEPASDASGERLVVWDGEKAAMGGSFCDPKNGANALAAQNDEAHGGRSAVRFHGEGSGWIGGAWNWHAFYPADSGDDIGSYANLSFWIKATVAEGQLAGLNVHLSSSNKGVTGDIDVKGYCPDLTDGAWHEVEIPLIDLLEKAKDFDARKAWELGIGTWSGPARTFTVLIDDIAFDKRHVRPHSRPVSLPEPRKPSPLGDQVVEMSATIDTSAEGTPISPYIYGIAMGDRKIAVEEGVTIERAGGNPITPLDWRRGFSGNGADWFFTNNGAETPPEKNWLVTFHSEDRKAGLESYLCIPIMGRVAKDATSYGFDRAKYPEQEKFADDAPHAGAGNGRAPKKDAGGKPVLDANGHPVFEDIVPDPDDSSVVKTPKEQCDMLRYMIEDMQYGRADAGGVKYVALDNEPALWSGTHRAMHPAGVSYDELWEKTETCATLLKAIDPGVQIAGPTSWGWTEYFFSGLDSQLIAQGKGSWDAPPDSAAHGGIPLTKWYLAKLAEHKARTGVSLVDILDVHFYPQAAPGGKRGEAMTREALVQETRVMWDPTWKDPSWMGTNADKPGVIRLIPMMREWIAQCNPGMHLSLGEYNFGGEDDVAGGIAQAELLGIYARERVDFAFYWFAPAMNAPTYFAYKMFRNPDGRHTAVGDRCLPSSVDRADDVSVHASKDAASGRIAVVMVNKRGATGAKVALKLSSAVPAQEPAFYEYGPADPGCIGLLPKRTVSGDTIAIELPAMTALRFDLMP